MLDLAEQPLGPRSSEDQSMEVASGPCVFCRATTEAQFLPGWWVCVNCARLAKVSITIEDDGSFGMVWVKCQTEVPSVQTSIRWRDQVGENLRRVLEEDAAQVRSALARVAA
jgi:hypothetical protein